MCIISAKLCENGKNSFNVIFSYIDYDNLSLASTVCRSNDSLTHHLEKLIYCINNRILLLNWFIFVLANNAISYVGDTVKIHHVIKTFLYKGEF